MPGAPAGWLISCSAGSLPTMVDDFACACCWAAWTLDYFRHWDGSDKEDAMEASLCVLDFVEG